MKRTNILLIVLTTLLFITPLLASIDGITGRTLKSGRGCSCHGSSASAGVIVTITGSDTVVLNQPTSFSLTISGGPASGSGCDIAAKYGSLSAVSSTLKLSGTELTQKTNTQMTSGSVTYNFSYVYTGVQTSDSLYATGLSSNSNGGSSGDQWNWAVSKKLVVVTATSVDDGSQYPKEFRLDQNYPNPFNPRTNIRGQEVASLVQSNLPAGSYDYTWDASGLTSGIYLYRLESSGYSKTMKLVLLK
jgi:hypothetical protein